MKKKPTSTNQTTYKLNRSKTPLGPAPEGIGTREWWVSGTNKGEVTPGGFQPPPAAAQEERTSSRGCRLKKGGSWQSEADPVAYFGKQDLERRFKLVPLVQGPQMGTEVWWWA